MKIIIYYDNFIEIRKKENNYNSLIQKIKYSSHFNYCEIVVKELENNRFIIFKNLNHIIQVWEKNNLKYICIYEKFRRSIMIDILFINNKLFLFNDFSNIYFCQHDFNKKNNLLIEKYKSKISSIDIELNDFKCQIFLKLKGYEIFPYYLHNNKIYLARNGKLYSVNIKNYQIKEYYIDFHIYSMIFISNKNVLFGNEKEIAEYEINNNKLKKIKICGDKINNNDSIYVNFIKGKNEDIFAFSDKILIFKQKNLLE